MKNKGLLARKITSGVVLGVSGCALLAQMLMFLVMVLMQDNVSFDALTLDMFNLVLPLGYSPALTFAQCLPLFFTFGLFALGYLLSYIIKNKAAGIPLWLGYFFIASGNLVALLPTLVLVLFAAFFFFVFFLIVVFAAMVSVFNPLVLLFVMLFGVAIMFALALIVAIPAKFLFEAVYNCLAFAGLLSYNVKYAKFIRVLSLINAVAVTGFSYLSVVLPLFISALDVICGFGSTVTPLALFFLSVHALLGATALSAFAIANAMYFSCRQTTLEYMKWQRDVKKQQELWQRLIPAPQQQNKQ